MAVVDGCKKPAHTHYVYKTGARCCFKAEEVESLLMFPCVVTCTFRLMWFPEGRQTSDLLCDLMHSHMFCQTPLFLLMHVQVFPSDISFVSCSCFSLLCMIVCVSISHSTASHVPMFLYKSVLVFCVLTVPFLPVIVHMCELVARSIVIIISCSVCGIVHFHIVLW